MDDDAIDRMIEESMKGIQSKIDTLSKDHLDSMNSHWKQERDNLRNIFIEFCNSAASRLMFVQWWQSITDDIKLALVMTSLEELQEIPEFVNMSDSLCSELKDPQLLIKDTKFMDLFNNLQNFKENDSNVFVEQVEMRNTYQTQLKDPQVIMNNFMVMRSYLLLSFFINIILVFESELDQLSQTQQ